MIIVNGFRIWYNSKKSSNFLRFCDGFWHFWNQLFQGKIYIPVPFPPAASDVSKASRMLFSLYLSCWSSWTWKAWWFGPVVHMPMVHKLGLDMYCLVIGWLVLLVQWYNQYNPSQNCPGHKPPSALVKELLWVGTPLVSSHAQRLKGQRATLYGHDVSGLVKAKNGCKGTDGMTQESNIRSMEDIHQTYTGW